MSLNLRLTLQIASVTGIAVLLMACGSNSGSNPATASSAVTVSVTGAAAVTLGSTAQYAATVTGSSNQAVSWTVNQTAGGSTQL